MDYPSHMIRIAAGELREGDTCEVVALHPDSLVDSLIDPTEATSYWVSTVSPDGHGRVTIIAYDNDDDQADAVMVETDEDRPVLVNRRTGEKGDDRG